MTARSAYTGQHRIYATSAFAARRVVAAEMISVPTAEVHAKEMGTTLTLCGESAVTWHKFWEDSFAESPAPRCPRCVAALARGAAGKAAPREH